ncbi:hypothetical protein [Williamsia herbipolensis]|uniref:hypothetical protein n=1 Tax=Williamsia herbipolensis TaxID=1603258 RepID=UPI0019393FFB|nr:hypothetical protein [Williamsia herbipolensis]
MSLATAVQSSSRLTDRLPGVGLTTMTDPSSGCRLTMATPDAAPDLWIRYLDGARAVYRAHRVSAALDYDAVADGTSTSVFFAVTDDHDVLLGGLRVQGAYVSVDQTHAVQEWAGCDGRDALIDAIDRRLDAGVVELKTAWVNPLADDPSAVSSLLARVALPVVSAMGVRYLMATAAEHVLRRWSSSGGRVDRTVPASPYPDDRYRTSLMWWDATTLARNADPTVYAQMRHDTAGLLGPDALLGSAERIDAVDRSRHAA